MKTFILSIKILIIPAFFLIANTDNIILANTFAGVAVIVMIVMYAFEYIETQKL